LSRSEPRSGATLGASPAYIRLWFDSPIEPLFATIHVENGAKRRVDKGDGRVSLNDTRLLEVEVPLLPPGGYRVFWSVVARDGHRRAGDFAFVVQ
jgi:methionine-rich copper-binding protein CopC